jgi:hypothetical protein
MKLKWIYWVSTGLLAAIYLGGGTQYLSNISGVTSRNKCDSILEIDATGRPLADKAREVIYWYFAEVTKMKADIGVSEVEKQAAGAGEDA